MKKFVLVLAISFGFFHAMYSQKLSPYAEVSLLTAGPGDELYSSFGHTAIRVFDPQANIDKVYGYGTFDFDDPLFYVKFARGKLNYKLDIDPFYRTKQRYGFIDLYKYVNRTVDEQILNINQVQKQSIYDFLEKNYLPENRYYLYDFFFDNCATRPRDVLKNALGEDLTFRHDHLPESMTFRELVDEYLQNKRWADFGIDLALGTVIDRVMESEEFMFHPDYLAEALDNASLKKDGREVPLVKQKQRLFEANRSYEPSPFYANPIFPAVLLSIAVLAATFIGIKQHKYKAWIDMLIFGLAGIGGIIVFLLMTATDHTATAWNMNVLWLLPTHLVIPFVIKRSPRPSWLLPYLYISAGILLLMLFGWPFLPQEMNSTCIPLVIVLLVRIGFAIYRILETGSEIREVGKEMS